VAAQTPVGLRAKDHHGSGALGPDDIVIALSPIGLIADAAQGFIIDGFPRTVPQATGRWMISLKKSHQARRRWIELRVNESALLQRVETGQRNKCASARRGSARRRNH